MKGRACLLAAGAATIAIGTTAAPAATPGARLTSSGSAAAVHSDRGSTSSAGLALAPAAHAAASTSSRAASPATPAAPVLGADAAARPPAPVGPCRAARLPGGDWPSYGHDSANTRSQPDEHAIGTAQAGGLTAAWVFSLASAGDAGQFNSTPVVSGGCAFVTASNGGVYAVDAQSGRLVWRTLLGAPVPGLGGALVGGVALAGDTVVVIVNQTGDGTTGPYVAALDRSTGAVAWRSRPLSTGSGYYSNATPQVFEDVLFAGFSPPEGDPTGQGGFALLDAETGAILDVTPTISPAHQAEGYAGGGIWSTPAFDPRTGYAYVGAGNPYSKAVEDVHTNAILKIDVERDRPTFGTIVASYKGNVDQYTQTLQALSQTPVCSVSTGLPDPLDDPACGQLDLDFGAAPNLFTVAGRTVVGDLQKSGVYHVADAAAMQPLWAATVGATCQACNAASTAVDAAGVAGASTPGGVMFSLARPDGSLRWATPVGDGVHYQGTSTANGVAYTFDTAGFLDAFDESTGLLLLRRPISADAQAAAASLSSGGIAIAYHTVFVAASTGSSSAPAQAQGSFLVAYRPGTALP